MRIGHYVAGVAGKPGYETNVSGHVQMPLRAMQLLKDAGHDIELVTTQIREDQSLPAFLPEGVPMHQVIDGRARSAKSIAAGDHRRGMRAGPLLEQVRQIKRVAKEREFDVLHFFGHNRTGHFAGALRRLGLRTPAVATVVALHLPERRSWLTKRLWKRADAIVCGAEHVQRQFDSALGVRAHVVRHGVVRDMRAELCGATPGPRRRVLFWRDPSEQNGADLALETFRRLAPEHPEISFDMAIRPYHNEVPGIEELARDRANVNVHRFPYPEGVTLPGLIAESICVLLPFRWMTIHPQLSIAETMTLETPVIATDIGSASDVIEAGESGLLVPPDDVDALTDATRRLIDDQDDARRMGERAAASVAESWNWDHYVEEIVSVYQRAIRGEAR